MVKIKIKIKIEHTDSFSICSTFIFFQTAMMSVDFLYYTPRYPILILQEFLLSIPMFSV